MTPETRPASLAVLIDADNKQIHFRSADHTASELGFQCQVQVLFELHAISRKLIQECDQLFG